MHTHIRYSPQVPIVKAKTIVRYALVPGASKIEYKNVVCKMVLFFLGMMKCSSAAQLNDNQVLNGGRAPSPGK